MQEIISNCYDSHVHLWATGQVALGLQLQKLKSAEDVRNLKIERSYFRQNWLIGFGWDQNSWESREFPNKKILDECFKDTPIFFSRVDGHASWVNTAAIKELELLGFNFKTNPAGGIIEKDISGEPTGILLDQAHINALMLLPQFTEQQNINFFSEAQKIFNRAGFTHVRDMSMTLSSWKTLLSMENKNDLSICVDAFVTAESLSQSESVLNEITLIKKEPSLQMRLNGIKIFIDGSLGSKTAYLSKNYKHTDSCGLLIWSFLEIKELIRMAWKAKQQVAIHCIGDEAAHAAVMAAREVAAEGLLGSLNLEHAQLLRFETIQMMKSLHVTCYMQPCHWLSDSPWLDKILQPEMKNHLFNWELLRKNKVPFYFGSDSPIEPTSLFNTKLALDKSSKQGVPELNDNWLKYHSHPDSNWCSGQTTLENGMVKQVIFKGKKIL